jgi:tetratricopeptide (TPR) repeat protein
LLADKGHLLFQSGHHQEALALLQQLEETDPSLSSTHAYLANGYFLLKNYPKWLAENRKVAELRHDAAGLALADLREKAYAQGGLIAVYQAEMPVQKDLVDRGSGSAFHLAEIYAALGNKQEAIASLQSSFDRRESPLLVGDRIPELQNEPAYLGLRQQVEQLLAQ